MRWMSGWFRAASLAGMSIASVCGGMMVSAGAAAAGPKPSLKCGVAHASPQAMIKSSGKKLKMGGDPTYACPGDNVQWNNSGGAGQSFEILFSSDLFREGRTFMIAGGQTLTLNVPAGAAPGDYKYSVCATSCSAAGTLRLDPHIIIMGR